MNEADENMTPEQIGFRFAARLGGSEYQLSVMPQFQSDDRRSAGEPLGSSGPYKVAITLGRPGFSVLQERQFGLNEQNKGDSHLATAPPALQLRNGQAIQLKQVIVTREPTSS
jgi:hypothetical protein